MSGVFKSNTAGQEIKGKKYKELNDIIVIYLTKKDIFEKGSTVYEVEMNIVSDQKEKHSFVVANYA